MSTANRYLVVGTAIIFCVFLALHYIVHDEPLSQLMSFRIGFTLVIFFVVSLVAARGKYDHILLNIVITNAVIQALIGIIHHYYYPNIITGTTLTPHGELFFVYPDDYKVHRENGLLENSNLYANMILLGLMALVFGYKDRVRSIIECIKLFLMFIMMYGILLSGSRYPSVIALIVFVYYLGGLFLVNLSKSYLWAPVVIISGLFVLFSLDELGSILGRFLSEGMGVRGIKNSLAVGVIFDSPVSVLLGEKTSIYVRLVSKEGIGISDNSFLALGMSFGLIYLVIYSVSILLLIFNTIIINRITILLISHYAINLFLTNAIYWDIYNLYFFITLCILGTKRPVEFSIYKSPAPNILGFFYKRIIHTI